MVLIFSFSLLFLFGCTDWQRDHAHDPNGVNYVGDGGAEPSSSSGSVVQPSSSSLASSSSSVPVPSSSSVSLPSSSSSVGQLPSSSSVLAPSSSSVSSSSSSNIPSSSSSSLTSSSSTTWIYSSATQISSSSSSSLFYSSSSTILSSSSSGNYEGNIDGECKDGSGNQYYCQWPLGCHAIDNIYTNKGVPCPDLVSLCQNEGELFINVHPSALHEGNGWGEGISCSNVGGTQVSECKDSNGSQYYCLWSGVCYALYSNMGQIGDSCQELVHSCQKDGKLFTGSCSNGGVGPQPPG
ncbi:MAG: hypothetical protein FWB90_00190 [Fibromonadales bacterium]|nr:hypothetical protein [Fibromonadales bacterium]